MVVEYLTRELALAISSGSIQTGCSGDGGNGVVIAGGSWGWIHCFCFQWLNGFGHQGIFF